MVSLAGLRVQEFSLVRVPGSSSWPAVSSWRQPSVAFDTPLGVSPDGTSSPLLPRIDRLPIQSVSPDGTSSPLLPRIDRLPIQSARPLPVFGNRAARRLGVSKSSIFIQSKALLLDKRTLFVFGTPAAVSLSRRWSERIATIQHCEAVAHKRLHRCFR